MPDELPPVRLIRYLERMVREGFHGTLHIRFWAGDVKKITTEQDHIVDTLPVDEE